jgi:hypothetical protein
VACQGLHTWSLWDLDGKTKKQTTWSLFPLTMTKENRAIPYSPAFWDRHLSQSPKALALTIPHPALRSSEEEDWFLITDKTTGDRKESHYLRQNRVVHQLGHSLPQVPLTYAAGLCATPRPIRLAKPPRRAHQHQRGMAGVGHRWPIGEASVLSPPTGWDTRISTEHSWEDKWRKAGLSDFLEQSSTLLPPSLSFVLFISWSYLDSGNWGSPTWVSA